MRHKHKWRVGSFNGILKGKRIIKESLNIWCEDCDEKIKAKLKPYELIKFPNKNATIK